MQLPLVAGIAASATLLACSLATSPTEYVSESTSGGGGGGAPASGGAGAGGGSGGTTSEGGGGAGPATVANVIVIGGYKDKPPEFIDANYFEDEVYDTWRADIGADGLLTSWRNDASTPLSGVFSTFLSSETGLVALGLSEDADSADRYMWLNTTFEDGLIKSWGGSVGWDFSNDRDYVRTATWGSYAYHFVGVEDDLMAMDYYSGRVEFASFDPATGAIGATPTAAPSVPAARARRSFSVIAAQGVLYLVGGYNAGNKAQVDTSVIGADGAPGPWNVQADLVRGGMPHAIYSATLCASDSHLYVIGGQGNNGPSEIVLYAALDAGGEITTWLEGPPLITGGVRNAGCFIHADHLYVLGGEGPSNRSSVVLSSEIASDGSLGPWSTDSDPLPFGRSSISAAVQSVGGGP